MALLKGVKNEIKVPATAEFIDHQTKVKTTVSFVAVFRRPKRSQLKDIVWNSIQVEREQNAALVDGDFDAVRKATSLYDNLLQDYFLRWEDMPSADEGETVEYNEENREDVLDTTEYYVALVNAIKKVIGHDDSEDVGTDKGN